MQYMWSHHLIGAELIFGSIMNIIFKNKKNCNTVRIARSAVFFSILV